MILHYLKIVILCVVWGLSAGAYAQPAASTGGGLLKAEELDSIVAPIALYPDSLLALVLMASTYPLEIVQADRWVKENGKLKGDALKAALDKQAWDESVKSLTAAPEVLTMMSSKLDWTQKLGDAVLAQQPDVMDAIQRLRTKAEAGKKLVSTKEQKVSKRQDAGKEVIVIEQTDPGTIYVPYYDPAVVYGGWPYPDYPAYVLPWPGYIPGAILASGLAFGAGYALGRWASGGNYWGGGVNWNNNNINVNRPRVNPTGGGNWQHNPAHREGVRYNSAQARDKFGNKSLQRGAQERMDFRGRAGNEVLKPDRGGSAQRPSAAQGASRPGAGQKPVRPSASQRPAGKAPAGAKSKTAAQPRSQRPAAARSNAMNVSSGHAARAQSARGNASLGSRGGGMARAGGGAPRGGGGRGGGGRRSDIALKHDVVLLGRLSNGIGLYRFKYNGGHTTYVGVLAQEVQTIVPGAVHRGRDGYLLVDYGKLGVPFQTYRAWIRSGHPDLVTRSAGAE